jgi:hypothetical protein
MEERYRLHHAEFRDFLVASYLAKALAARRFDRFGSRGFTVNVFRLAGSLLKDFTIDEQLVSELIAHSQRTGEWFVYGNVGALIGNSTIPFEGPAIDALMGSLNALTARHDILGRMVMLAAWGYRALRVASGDSSATALRLALVRVLSEYASGRDDCDPITRSMAWCYLRAFQGAGQSGLGLYTGGLETEAAQRVALEMIFETNDQGWMSDRSRDFQTAFLEMQYSAPFDNYRPISAIHYLYCISCAYHKTKHIKDIGSELPILLAPGSRTETMAREAPYVADELSQILDCCRGLVLGGIDRGPASPAAGAS